MDPAMFTSTTESTASPVKRNIVAGIDFIIAREQPNDPPPSDSSALTEPTPIPGPLPDVPCNKQAYSPRFGGRCAAPVVQYLAYDEAYHASQPDPRFDLPQYGGCLAGGKMRYLGANVMADSATYQTQWDGFYEWWTPPLWPVDAWHNLESLDPAGRSSQQKMNSLFAYQDAFKLSDPIRNGPAGRWKKGRVLMLSQVVLCVQSLACQ